MDMDTDCGKSPGPSGSPLSSSSAFARAAERGTGDGEGEWNLGDPEVAARILREIVPFRALDMRELRRLAARATPRRAEAGEILFEKGDTGDHRVFVVAEGAVEALDVGGRGARRETVISAGSYFGERAPLFDAPRAYQVRAMVPTRLLEIPGSVFLELLQRSAAFAQAVGGILRVKQGVFHHIDNFLAEISHGASQGSISLQRLIPLYRRLEPALHPGANRTEAIDFPALLYAVRRLPDNITRTFMLFLADDLPPLYAPPEGNFRRVDTATRPRSTYEMVPGKSLILLRDGLSDLLDLLCCLCLYSVETRKIRRRLTSPEQFARLAKHDARNPISEADSAGGRDPGPGPERESESESGALREFGLSAEEVDSFRRVWPRRPVERLREILLQHEDVGLALRKQLNNYNARPAEAWAAHLAADVRELLGHDPSELPPEITVHVISSNTHSVTNCLSPHVAREADRILSWGERTGHPLLEIPWANPRDRLYAVARDYLEAHPGEREARTRLEREHGILRRRETAFTGIQFELVDTSRLGSNPGDRDPDIAGPPGHSRALIVNIDFAFGQQAREIIAGLVMLFHRNLASVNVLGKAGTLAGSRGDALAPTAFVEQQSDQYHPFSPPQPVDLERLQGRIPGRRLHVGPMLTVLGTLLQNRMLLNYYRRVWQCVGLEMEGYYYQKHIRESIDRGVVDPRIPLRFLYYVSDAPLEPGATLSESLAAAEGIPPLYAITREILSAIFEQESERQIPRRGSGS